MKDPVIVAYGRSAVGKAPRGKLKYTRTASIAAQVVRGMLDSVPQVPSTSIDDLILGCAFPEAEQGTNLARAVGLRSGLPDTVAGQTVNRFCASGVQTIAAAHAAIVAGHAEALIAGGAESMSLVPGGGNLNFPEPELLSSHPGLTMGMGITAENVADRYGVSREKQDRFALASHQKAEEAQKLGYFAGQIIPIQAVEPDGNETRAFSFDQDEGIRYGSTLEALEKLKPVFKLNGTVTAGNSSQTSDGAGFVLMMTRRHADDLGLNPIARVRAFSVVGVPPEIMGIGPLYAIPKVLQQAGLSLEDIDLIELNEAFASQSIACIEGLHLPEDKVNVNGGAIALGHPLGGSGAILTVKLLAELARRKQQLGLVSMCIGGGMGAAIVYEMV